MDKAIKPRKKLFIQVGPLFFASIFSILANTILGIYLGRIFEPNQYGQLLFFIAFFGNIRFVSSIGMGAKTIKDIASASAKGDDLNQVFYSLIFIRFVTLLLTLLLVIVWWWVERDNLILLAGFVAMFAVMFDFFYAFFQGLSLFRLVAFIAITQPVVYMTGIILVNKSDIINVIYMFAVSFIISLVAIFPFLTLHRSVKIAWPERMFISMPYIMGSIGEMWLLFLLGVLRQFVFTFPVVLLGSLELFADAAVIGIVLTLVTMYDGIVQLTVWGWLMPSVRKSFSLGDLDDVNHIMRTYIEPILLLGIWAFAIGSVWSDYILNFLYDNQYDDAAIILTVGAILIPTIVYQRILNIVLVSTERNGKAVLDRLIQAVIVTGFTCLMLLAVDDNETRLLGVMIGYVLGFFVSGIYLQYLLYNYLGWKWIIPIRYLAIALAAVVVSLALRLLITDVVGFHAQSTITWFMVPSGSSILLGAMFLVGLRTILRMQSASLGREEA